jgi:hypothetical protein
MASLPDRISLMKKPPETKIRGFLPEIVVKYTDKQGLLSTAFSRDA